MKAAKQMRLHKERLSGASNAPGVVTREMRRQLERDNAKLPAMLIEFPCQPESGQIDPKRFKVMRSRYFLVQFFQEEEGLVRLSINRTTHNGERWDEGITWEELQQLKREAGYGDCDAMEIYPRDVDVVNVANMRHLWVRTAGFISFAWRSR